MLVFHLMLQTSPRIHGNRPQLNFCKKMAGIISFYVFIRSLDIDNHMITAIAVGLHILDVILFFDDADT